MNNKQRITLVSFLAYFVLSGMLAPIGIISHPMAELYGRPVAEITSQFSWLTGGDFIGAVAALFVFAWIDLRRMLVLIYGLIAVSLLSLGHFHSLVYGRIVLGIAGLCAGIGLAGAALIIARTYQAERRASLLVITDSCFSVAGFVCGSLASYFVARQLGWSSTYECIGLLAAVIVAISLASTFPATNRKATTCGRPRPGQCPSGCASPHCFCIRWGSTRCCSGSRTTRACSWALHPLWPARLSENSGWGCSWGRCSWPGGYSASDCAGSWQSRQSLRNSIQMSLPWSDNLELSACAKAIGERCSRLRTAKWS